MASLYDDLIRITEPDTTAELRRLAMRDFAEQLDWTPSYELHAAFGVSGAADHVIVEHGLSNSAVITFLRGSMRAAELDQAQLRSLLAISYNNLVEWHLFVSQSDVRRVNNLADPGLDSAADIWSALSPSHFAQDLASDRFRPFAEVRRSMRACDDALIAVISRWKRLLKADYPAANNRALSTLFNALIFVRGCEDRRLDRNASSGRLLPKLVATTDAADVNLKALLTRAMAETGVNGQLTDYVDVEALTVFDHVDRATAQDFVRDFYTPREAPYDFNFALMSKHALSRIYERYVSLLVQEDEEAEQLSFVASVPKEKAPTRTGAIYTPQFIAGFFARYIRENTTPRRFRTLRSLDPACGSGIFLRTLLELQCNPFDPAITKATISDLFSRAEGFDRDPNATEATRLSLALLHLVATDQLPQNLAIHTAEAISSGQMGQIPPASFGAVLTNPPYIKHDHLGDEDRQIFKGYLGETFKGRLDSYLSFVKLCLEATEPSGLACFVLPQTFLTAGNAAFLRKQIAQEFDVKCLVDLSAVDVFEGVGAYSILMIIQRRTDGQRAADTAIIAQATDFVGAALQAVLDGRQVESSYYRVFQVPQQFFADKNWVIVGPDAMALDRHLRSLPKLGDYADCFQGFVTGADEIFIRPKGEIPDDEMNVYMDFLPDRQIARYSLPSRVGEAVFYPYLGENLITEQELKDKFAKTWKYLSDNRTRLEARRRSPSTPWWKPERPREPSRMRRPKIVCPHLMLTPRFAVDVKGKFATSHGPAIAVKDPGEEQTLLFFLCGILNSLVANWYIRTYVPSYSKGYSRLEPATLRNLPIPRLENADPAKIERFIELVKNSQKDLAVEDEIEELAIEFYELGAQERRAIGMSL